MAGPWEDYQSGPWEDFAAAPASNSPETIEAYYKRMGKWGVGDPATPFNQALSGLGEIWSGKGWEGKAGGVNRVLGAAGQAMAPIGAAAALLNPVGAIGAVGGGLLGGGAAKSAASGLGAGPNVSETFGNAGGLLGGAGVGKLASAAVPKIGSLLQSGAKRLYQSALKPAPSTPKEDITKAVNTALQERIPVSERGYDDLGNRIEGINQQIKAKVANSPFELDPLNVTARMEQIRPTFANQVNPEADLGALSNAKAEYLRKHTIQAPFTKVAPGLEEESGRLIPVGQGSTPMVQAVPAVEAQAEKMGTYRQLRGKYNDLKGADIEAQKTLARGIKEELAANIPEIGSLNARDSRLIQLSELLERAANRNANSALVPIGDWKVAAAKKLVDNPWLKSKTAIGANRLGGLLGQPQTPLPYWLQGLLGNVTQEER